MKINIEMTREEALELFTEAIKQRLPYLKDEALKITGISDYSYKVTISTLEPEEADKEEVSHA